MTIEQLLFHDETDEIIDDDGNMLFEALVDYINDVDGGK